MKKILLSIGALALLSGTALAQQTFSLYEEFSGENCNPCAAANPGLWALLNSNPSKVILLKYQSPIPTAGPLYYQNTPDVNNRLTYYSVPFAPYGRLNGTGLGTGTAAPQSPGHVANLTQADINNANNVVAPFTISVTHSWSPDGDSVYATVTVTCTQNYPASGAGAAQLKLRAALAEHLTYNTPPGTNGETDFHNVMRKMYPSPDGTAVANTWTSGTTQTFTISGPVPNYVNKTNSCFMVVWLQNDADKSVPQAAVSTPIVINTDVAVDSSYNTQRFSCTTTTNNIAHSAVIKNAGTTPLTSANIYFKADNASSYQVYNWTGTLAPGATTTVALPATPVGPGARYIVDSVGMPNNQEDINQGNNYAYNSATVVNTTPNTLPQATGFENGGAMPANYILHDVDGNGNNWQLVTGTGLGHANSAYTVYHNNYGFAAGETNLIVLPTPNIPSGTPAALDFYVAYAQYQAENDKLELVYTTDCGQNWTSVWSQAGSDLKTAPPTTDLFIPTQSQWKKESIDISSIPSGAVVALRATSDYGNTLFVDDINMRTGTPQGVEEIIANGYVRLFPNPAQNGNTTLSFTLKTASTIHVDVLDAVGRVVATVANDKFSAGAQSVQINTSALSTGIYTVRMATEKGTHVERLSVVK